MRYASVCSGIEAATVAWHSLGWTPVFFSEIEPFPCAVLAHHYPDVPNYGDMTKFKEWPDATIDVLVGGTPCQSFSVAGLRKGLEDPRGNLMLTYLAIAERYRPQWIVWENVPGVLSSNGGRDFGAFLGALGQLGYGWAYRVLDAQWFGVAQRRRRVFVVANARSWQRAAAVLFERESLRRDSSPSREKGKSIARNSQDRLGSGGIPEVAETLIATDHKGPGHNRDHNFVAQPIGTDCYNGAITGSIAATLGTPGSSVNASGPTVMQPAAFAQNQLGEVRVGKVTNTLNTNSNSSGRNTPMVAQPVAFEENFNAVREVEVAPAMTTEGYSTSQNAGGLGLRYDMQVRRLTPIECERLQGFPDGYTNIPWRKKPESPDGPRYKALGNSMAVPVMRWIGERIVAVDAL